MAPIFGVWMFKTIRVYSSLFEKIGVKTRKAPAVRGLFWPILAGNRAANVSIFFIFKQIVKFF